MGPISFLIHVLLSSIFVGNYDLSELVFVKLVKGKSDHQCDLTLHSTSKKLQVVNVWNYKQTHLTPQFFLTLD